MGYLDLSIKELHQLIKDGKIKPTDLYKESLEKAKKLQPVLNPFVTIVEDQQINSNDINNPLYGIPFALKDNFSTKNILSTASSNILKNYIPVYDSTVYSKLKNAGALCIGKTSMDELALGGTGLNAHTGVVHNPYDVNRLSGGSSAGSVVAVSSGIVPFAIGSDTGDSTRKPAAFNGVVGFKPTWGAISRFGLFPFATSLDHVGIFTRNVEDCAYVFENLIGNDSKDMTSLDASILNFNSNLNDDIKGLRIATIKEINNSFSNQKVKDLYNQTIKKLEDAGAIIKEESIDERLLRAILPVYLVISCSEATSNDANLDGIKFGPREQGDTYIDSIINTRTKNISELVRRRFVIGAYALRADNQDKLFIRAQKVRRAIVNEVNKILNSYDVVLFPASGDIAPLASSSSNEKLSSNYLIGENHLAIGNFGGFPSLTLPNGFVDGMPVGINITGKVFEDKKVLDASSAIEKVLGYKNLVKEVL